MLLRSRTWTWSQVLRPLPTCHAFLRSMAVLASSGIWMLRWLPGPLPAPKMIGPTRSAVLMLESCVAAVSRMKLSTARVGYCLTSDQISEVFRSL